MKSFRQAFGLALAVASYMQPASAQEPEGTTWTHPGTGISFNRWTVPASTVPGTFSFGMTLPSNALTVDASEYVGVITCPSPNGINSGWCGVSHGPSMTNNLLLFAWPYNGQVIISPRWTQSYEVVPAPYTGGAIITQIASTVNSTHFEAVFRCRNCLSWDQDGATGSLPTTSPVLVMAWAVGFPRPTNPQCPANVIVAQHERQSIWGAFPNAAIANPSYSAIAARATNTVNGNCGGTVTSTGSAPPTSATATSTSSAVPGVTGLPVPNETWDYVIVGAGAGGIPMADKLSEAGKKVLLIEKGPPSSGRWGGDRKPAWLAGTNLTRFDVPGLCNQIWADSSGIACGDTDQMAGCVLGGGTAINAALWWKPNALDWDYNFPSGWKASDVQAATNRVFSRIPGTTTPSSDGQVYLTAGFNVIQNGLQAAGWKVQDHNANPNSKNRTVGRTPYMYSNGERGGPMATYLVTASRRSNFKLWTRTSVRRAVRTGGHVTAVEVEAFQTGGYTGTVRLTPVTGRLIVSAGTFGSAKFLLRSGIGPADQLAVVQNSPLDGATMISNSSWINLPVGYNLEDHTNTDTVVSHNATQFYDFYEAFDNPPAADRIAYLQRRAGILAQSAPNIGPLFFEEIRGADNTVRQFQYTARMEGSLDVPNGKSITISQYLGRGAKSRGRMTITPALNTVVSTHPYLRDSNDYEAVVKGIENIQNSLKNVPGLTFNKPAPGQTARAFVDSLVVAPSNRRANHWIGTNKLGTDDGRMGGTAVVDLNTKVYGTDNLFVVDASIFPGMVTTNPSAYFVVASEHAASKILALPVAQANSRYGQCGGRNWYGSFQCASGSTCQCKDEWYCQCL